MSGEQLKRILKKMQVKTKLLAEKMHVSPQNISDIYKRKNIGSDKLEEICRVLDIKINDLYKETDLYFEPLIPDGMIDSTNEEIIRLRAENDVLRELVGLKGKDVKHAV